ncbi:YbaB/EbfC family nucleoid-associated protein [Nocardia asiatica]|uniref:YbaB/EbfC family nucleoid-associated protein n=1 Tax=Nocardia asiatica TaxID=209252 RepID=UPI0024537A52|nr:YbaB/EbfC family nucleoid-associated protein [Nocardia asiatica]
MDEYEQQRSELAEIGEQLQDVRGEASSPDGFVTVTVDCSGVVTDVRLDPKALRTPPEDLARIVTETARAAARLAHQQVTDTISPITDIVGSMPDLAELLPGAPSLREQESAVTDVPEDEYDEYDEYDT